MSEETTTKEEIPEKPVETTASVSPTSRRLVYLAGPIELEDTWRDRASKALIEMGFGPLDPLRNEEYRAVGKHIKSELPDSLIVSRDIHDLMRDYLSGGFTMMNLSTTADGRKPIGTLFEMQWCWDRDVPVIAIMGRDCSPEFKKHPWIRTMVSYEATSVKDALELIEEYFV